MIVGVPRESFPGERRVAIVPAIVPALIQLKLEVLVESGAGEAAGIVDAAFEEKGARIATSRDDVFKSEIVIQVRAGGANPEAGQADLARLSGGQTLIAFLDPLSNPNAQSELARRGISAFAMELMPRITRAQSMDALSSMATIAGYKAVLLAANTLPRMFPMMMTAAGTIAPARAFVIGAGVAGLQAIASARRLGAVVRAYDVRPTVADQVRSVGGEFVELTLEAGDAEDKRGYAKAQDETFYKRQRELMARVVGESDVVITTAAIPGKPAPVLITEDMVRGMTPGSVIVDLAAERGGNCELTRADEIVVVHGVTILGPTNLPSTVPFHASQLYARNLATFLKHLMKDSALQIDADDEITRETLICRGGEVVHKRTQEILSGQAPGAPGSQEG
jgi:NAD(P) transhydrogenase subunit alpha